MPAEGRLAQLLASDDGTTRATFRINWAVVLFVCFFLAYGYFGAATPPRAYAAAHPIAFALALTALAALLAAFGMLASRAPAEFRDIVSFGRRDAIAGVLLTVVVVALSAGQLGNSLYVDEIAYSMGALRHSLVASLALTRAPTRADAFPFKLLVQALSLLALGGLAALFAFVRRFRWKQRIIIVVAVFVVGRVAITVAGGNVDAHPPLSLVPPLVFASVFGIADWSIKASSLVALCVFLAICYRLLARVLSAPLAFLFALAVGTVPLLLHLGGIVEPSLWGAMLFTYVVIEAATTDNVNYVRIASVIAIAALMRLPSFTAMVFLGCLWISARFGAGGNKKPSVRVLGLACLPCLLFLPFLAVSLVLGTPSTDGLGSSGGAMSRVWGAVHSSVPLLSAVNSIPPWWLVLIPLAIIPLPRRTISRNLALFALLACNTVMFYAISPNLYGAAKYQAEYALPFAIAGGLFLVLRLATASWGRYAAAVALAGVIALDVRDWSRFPEGMAPLNIHSAELWSEIGAAKRGRRLLVADSYDYSGAFAFVKGRGLAQSAYSMGHTYGILPEIINGYSVAEIRSVASISKRLAPVSWSSADGPRLVDRIDSDSSIKSVLLGVVPDRNARVAELLGRGWRVTAKFVDRKYGSSVIVMERSSSF